MSFADNWKKFSKDDKLNVGMSITNAALWGGMAVLGPAAIIAMAPATAPIGVVMGKVTSMALPALVGLMGMGKAAMVSYEAAKLNLEADKKQFDKQQEKQKTKTKFRDKWKSLSRGEKAVLAVGAGMSVFTGLGAVAMGAMGNLYGTAAYLASAFGFGGATVSEYNMAQYAAYQRKNEKVAPSVRKKENTRSKSKERTNWVEIQPQTLNTVKGRMYQQKTEEKEVEADKTPTVNKDILKYLKKERSTKE